MELSRDIIIDILLNMAGYLTAGALWLVMYALVTGRARAAAAPKVKPAPVVELERPATRPEPKAEFVSLKTASTSRNEDLEERDRLRAEVTRYQRNRAEVIRIAREMLKSGTSRDNIRNLLPISEGELALLSNE